MNGPSSVMSPETAFSSEASARALAARYAAPQEVQRAYEALGPVWDELFAVTAHTPDDTFDLMVNRADGDVDSNHD